MYPIRIPSFNAIIVYHFVKLFCFVVDDILIFSKDRIFFFEKIPKLKIFLVRIQFQNKNKEHFICRTSHRIENIYRTAKNVSIGFIYTIKCLKVPVFVFDFFFFLRKRSKLFERSLCDHTAIAHTVKRRKKKCFEKSYLQETERCEIKENRMIYMRTPPHI